MTMNEKPLTIYKASAGSGKTFTLACRYIALLVRNPLAYRRTLAVTFTNKATAEMKDRILSQLYGISHGLESSDSYLEAVCGIVGSEYDDNYVRMRCGQALDLILQDYGHFRVETIDSFFQSILHGLARELQLGGNLSIELDTDTAISDAVDAFIQSLDPDSDTGRSVIRFIEDNMSDDKNWSIEEKLKKFSKQLFDEVFMENSHLLDQVMDNPDAIDEYRKAIISDTDKKVAEYHAECRELGCRLQHASASMPIKVQHYLRDLIDAISSGTFLDKDSIGTTITACISDPDRCFDKKPLSQNPSASFMAQELIVPHLEQALNLYEENRRTANTGKCSLRYLHEMGLLLDIRREINRQCRENGRFLLADTANLLNLVQDGDTSFVFEKTGSFTSQMMIDEFQDTSRLQWNNLCILLRECLSQNHSCLLVGDVKQSIYRWRGSDWNIFNKGVEQELGRFGCGTENLGTNRRSLPAIIEFNNTLFPCAEILLSEAYERQFHQKHPDLEKAYDGVCQKTSKNDARGNVHTVFAIPDQSDNEDPIPALVEAELDRLTAAGVNESDITILCRTSKDIRTLADYFTQVCHKYKVTSAEAFTLGASYSVRIMVNTMRWLMDDSDRLSLAMALWEWNHYVLQTDCSMQDILMQDILSQIPETVSSHPDYLRGLNLFELGNRLYQEYELDKAPGQDAYTMCFLDQLRHFSNHAPGDIASFCKLWDMKLSAKSIPPARQNGIMLMTIHKSKGLEFHSVIIPYCDWQMVENSSTRKPKQIWIKPQIPPFDSIPLLPVEFKSDLEDSLFIKDYMTEAGLQVVDNLNLLYVAFTRPMCNLSIIGVDKPQKESTSKGPKPLSVTALDIVRNAMYRTGMSDMEQEEWTTGDIVPSGSIKKTGNTGNPFDEPESAVPVHMQSHEMQTQFKQSIQSERFIHYVEDDSESSRQDSFIETGKLMHALFSKLETAGQIDREVDSMLSEGLIESVEKADILKQKIKNYLDNSKVSDWFSGRYVLFNENTVLFRENGIMQNRRPDRVMTDGRHAIVVDFKFGNEREEHLYQVREYAGLLQKMGYSPVDAFIWYVYQNKIVDAINH
ncbi:MAG: UvrD-helicase domain-containing protein [Bacteroidaceae bacterium]|nr:UvrD-helicase domain-containing protein [Bacteroidaceae bacterium]